MGFEPTGLLHPHALQACALNQTQPSFQGLGRQPVSSGLAVLPSPPSSVPGRGGCREPNRPNLVPLRGFEPPSPKTYGSEPYLYAKFQHNGKILPMRLFCLYKTHPPVKLVGLEGLEPPRNNIHLLLKQTCLPFHHSPNYFNCVLYPPNSKSFAYAFATIAAVSCV